MPPSETRKLTKHEVDAAIAAARQHLEGEGAWIRKSVRFERTYFLGLLAGLEAIAEKADVQSHAGKILLGTYWERRFDADTFAGTGVGQAFEDLKQSLTSQLHAPATPAAAAWDEFTRAVFTQYDVLRSAVRSIEEMRREFATGIGRIHSLDPNDPEAIRLLERQHDLLHVLEHFARIVALLETDHDRWKGLET